MPVGTEEDVSKRRFTNLKCEREKMCNLESVHQWNSMSLNYSNTKTIQEGTLLDNKQQNEYLSSSSEKQFMHRRTKEDS